MLPTGTLAETFKPVAPSKLCHGVTGTKSALYKVGNRSPFSKQVLSVVCHAVQSVARIRGPLNNKRHDQETPVRCQL